MNPIDSTFETLASKGEGAYIPYVCAGDPDSEFTVDLVRTLCESGADLIELGMPFSDPIADGVAIQGSMKRALGSGFTPEDLIEIVSSVRAEGIRQPLVLMCYYNTILQKGIEGFCTSLADAGVNGLLVVDLPIEESGEIEEILYDNGLHPIRLIAPSTPRPRLHQILSKATGFAYLVSVSGTTGARDFLDPSTLSLLRRVSSISRLPVVLGFGISKPSHARQAFENGAAGVVEGSKLITIYENSEREEALASIARHATLMKNAMRPGLDV